MGTQVEKDGYTAELTDDLEIVYRNPQRRKLKQLPAQLADAPGIRALHETGTRLRDHREECRRQAEQWARVQAVVPRALADADPMWRKALEAECVQLTDELGEGGLWARTYAGFDGRTHTQLLPEQLIPFRDQLMRGQGWEPEDFFSTGIPDPSDGELPFPERVLAAHPGLEEPATEKILLLRARTNNWAYVFKKDIDAVLQGLEETAPALLTTLLDEMADLALRHEDRPTATAWFGRARTCERTQAREVDHEWLLRRYLTYAEAGALSATTLRAWLRDLAVKGVATPEDLPRFRDVVTRRMRASSEVYPQLAQDLRKLAKAAGADPESELATLLEDILRTGHFPLNDEKFWADCLTGTAVDLLTERVPETPRTMLDQRPHRSLAGSGLWLSLLERTGALALLTGEAPGMEAGEAAAWLSVRIATLRDGNGIWPAVHEIAERIAPKLRADGVPVDIRYQRIGTDRDYHYTTPLNLIDLLLEHGAPVADPPELLGPCRPSDVELRRRPELTHLQADPRFARELRARTRVELEMTLKDLGDNRWYQPHQSSKGWDRIPPLFDNPLGHEEIRAWFGRERAKLRTVADFDELVLLLGRLVHAGVALDLLPKDPDTAAEFAAVDVVPLLMAKLPDTVTRPQVEELLGRLTPCYVARDGVQPPNREPIRQMLPQLGDPARSEAASLLVMAVNCRAGLEQLARRFTPVEDEATPAGRKPANADERIGRSMIQLAQDDTAPVWDGDLTKPTTTYDRLLDNDGLRHTHVCAAPLALCAVSTRHAGWLSPVGPLTAYATHPLVTGEPGRWRIVRCEVPEYRGIRAVAREGEVFRTATSVAYVMASGGRAPRRTLWEYAPDGDFPEDGPLAAGGATLTDAHIMEPVRPGAWFTRFAELYREHGHAPARPELATAFAQRLGLTPAEATVLLTAHVPCTPRRSGQLLRYRPRFRSTDLKAWKIRGEDAKQAIAVLTDLLGPERVATLYDKLLPDDPELLWTTGPDVDRAAAWWLAELGTPLPVPMALLPLAAKEILPPQGEEALPRQMRQGIPGYRPRLRLPTLLARVAAGADCLAPHPADGPEGAPQPTALPRIAAWIAYRTPAGDPLRPAVGATIARLREETAAVPGPLTLFSLQSNHLMGPPPATDALTAHPAVTEADDPVYDMRRLHVDPAALKGPDDPLLDALDAYLDSVLPSQWLPGPSGLPALADLRLLLSDDFAALGRHLSTDTERPAGWEQHPERSVPHLVEECARAYGLSRDAASLFLMLLALPDPTDRNVRTWTGWKPGRFKEAEAELAASGRVLRTVRPRAGRSLFLPGAWLERKRPRLPVEASKPMLLPLAREHRSTSHLAAVPCVPLPALFTRAWEGAGTRRE
ncbi:hypothetical protein [Streptomyces sp. JHA26]|uniref:hypothetical protein n=1 Tax=Streptomyces sp. JHA26 TaxID=1917143 RepID=UPI00098BC2D3|nr:hypothetical protein [Streptomyces sp. JHA26]